VLSLFLVIVLLAVVLTAALWFGTVFLQSYFYTEPSDGVFWQAPLAACLLTLFYLGWSLLNVWGGTKTEIPYGVLWEFNNRSYLTPEPVSEFESKKLREEEPRIFKRDKVAGPYVYKRVDEPDRWSPDGVEWIKLKYDNTEYTFVADKQHEGRYRVFVEPTEEWELREVDMGWPTKTFFGRVVVYFFLNAGHLVLWILCCWLVLRFAPAHAVGLGLAMWLLVTLAVFPGLFGRALAAV
jgi:hypothetical protein